MPCQGMSPLMNSAAGFSDAILATSARLAAGLVACVSAASVNRISPYATRTRGSGSPASGTVNVAEPGDATGASDAGGAGGGPACRGPQKAIDKISARCNSILIGRCYAQRAQPAMRFPVLALLIGLCGLGAAHAAA